VWVYALTDPRDSSTRYVGITNNLNSRYIAHLQGVPNNAEKNTWIREVLAEQLFPTIQILERFSGSLARQKALIAERHWILEAQRQGCPLLNR
jgi:predicted GIY-YIG superfamily endonuclease